MRLLITCFIIACLFIEWSVRTAKADESRCINGFINQHVERVCDLQQGTVCYITHDNGHGIDTLSCVRP
jgi:hypothetical protein